jgi:hypothetical protein
LKSVDDEFIEDKEHILILPGKPLDTNKTQQVKVHSDSLVRFDNHFTVYQRDLLESLLRLRHYIDLLEKRPRAVGQAQPIRQTIDKRIREFRGYLPANASGDREFIKILRLVLDYGQSPVIKTIETCLAAGAHSYEAVRFELLQSIPENTPVATIDHLDSFGAEVKNVDLSIYDSLMEAGGVQR